MPNCPYCGRFMSRGLMEEETELSSKVYECKDCDEKVATNPNGYWAEIDKERGGSIEEFLTEGDKNED